MKKKDKNKPVAEPELQEAEPLEPEVSDAPAEEEHVATAEEWQAALELAVKQRDEFKDSLLRAQADFQNFKRRNQTARSDGYDDGVREAIAAMLPAIDNLERAIDAAENAEDEAAKALADGVKMTLNTLMESLGVPEGVQGQGQDHPLRDGQGGRRGIIPHYHELTYDNNEHLRENRR